MLIRVCMLGRIVVLSVRCINAVTVSYCDLPTVLPLLFLVYFTADNPVGRPVKRQN